MLFILNLAIGAGSGLALSIPFLGWLEGTVHKRMRNTAQKGMAQCSTAQGKGKCEPPEKGDVQNSSLSFCLHFCWLVF